MVENRGKFFRKYFAIFIAVVFVFLGLFFGIKNTYALNKVSNPFFATDASGWTTATDTTTTDTCGVAGTAATAGMATFAFDGTNGNPSGSFRAISGTSNNARYKSYIRQSITVPGSGTVKIKGRFDYFASATTWRASNVDGHIKLKLYDSTNTTLLTDLGCVQLPGSNVAWTTLGFGSDYNATGGTTYVIRATIAYRNSGTSTATIRVDNIIVTTAPTGLAVTAPAGTSNAQVDWTASTAGTGAAGLHGTTPYKVYRNTSSPVSTFLANATTNSYTDSSTSGNTTYYYAVSDVDTNSIESPLSAEVSVLTRPSTPGTPTFSNIGETSLRASWTAPTGGATSYKVERCSGSGCSSFSQIASGVTSLFYDDSSLSANTIYRYQIRATNASGDGAYSGIGSTLTLPAAPGIPTFSSVGETSLRVNWTAPTGGAASYKVERCSGSGCTSFAQIGTTTNAYYDDSSLNANTIYRYQIRGTNASGDGAYSGIGSVTTSVSLPGIPGTPTFSNISETSLRASWTAASGATSYKVERCQGSGCSSFSQIASGVTTLYYDDSSLNANTIYRYQIRATNSSGDGAYSGIGDTLTLSAAPGTPTFSNVGETSLRASWTAPTGGATSYKVERCTGSGCSSFSQIASGVTNTFYDDSSLSANTTYRYQIRATNASGDGAYSGIGSVTTSATPIITVSTTGSQTSSMIIPSADQYVGGSFTFFRSAGSTDITQITLTETGTVDANINLSNAKIYYETSDSCSYEGTEALFGSVASFNASAKATISGTMTVGASQVCAYVVLDVGSGASDGQTLEIEISNPSTEVVVSAGTVAPSSSVAISGTTTLSVIPSITVSTTGTQTGSMIVSSINNYVGGAFTLSRSAGSTTVTQIIISETGTVNANANLSNAKIYFETTGVCSFDGSETLFGTAASFNVSAKATISGTMTVGASQVCAYVVLDVGSGASDGQTLEIEISNPSTEVVVSAGTVSPATAVAIAGTTNLLIKPVVTSVSPNNGKLAGNTSVTITGTGFLSGASVSFGGSSATNIVVASSTSITAKTPAHSAGAVDVVVTNTNGQAGTSTGGYSYNPFPTISSVDPAAGPTGGNTNITITGTGFLSGASVTFGGSSATNIVVVSNTSITAKTPAHSAGAVDVVVTNVDTQSGTLASGFSYTSGPVITSISPDNGKLAGGTNVTITGGNFQSGATIIFNSTPATNVIFVSGTTITATTPAHSAGLVNVTVTNPDTQSHTLTGGYTYNPLPTVSSVSPSSGSTSGANITITGTGFLSGATVTFGGSSATNIIVVSSASITASAPAHAVGTVDVVVTNPDTQSGTLLNGFSYVGPPVINLTASPTTIFSGELSVLNWTSTDANTCAASGSWSGGKATTGNEIVSPTSTATYTLTCDGSGGSTQNSVIVTVSAQAPTPTAGSTGINGAQFRFDGLAYANGTVFIYDSGAPIARLITGDDGSFSTIFRIDIIAKHLYSIIAYDKNKQSSPVKTFPSDVYSSRHASDILIAPTINLNKRTVSKKGEINVYGYATPERKVKIEIDGKVETEISSSETGYYNAIISAAKFSEGSHKIKTRQIDVTGRESDYSILKLFNVSEPFIAITDLNGDNVLNITDWSIFLSGWASKDAKIRLKIDFNNDGKITIADLSIFLNAFSKKKK